jgi:hypothetical protein
VFFFGGGGGWIIAGNVLLLGQPEGQFCVRIATLSSYDCVTGSE